MYNIGDLFSWNALYSVVGILCHVDKGNYCVLYVARYRHISASHPRGCLQLCQEKVSGDFSDLMSRKHVAECVLCLSENT